MKKIDSVDLKIMQIITTDARIPIKEISDICGVSRAAVHQRIIRLTNAGIITGSGYNVIPKSVGYTTCTYVGIKLERGSMYKEVATQLKDIVEIVECHFTTGPYTMLVKLYSRNNEHLMDLLNNHIQKIPGVVSTETLISLEETFSRNIPVVLPNGDDKSSSRKMKSLLERINSSIFFIDEEDDVDEVSYKEENDTEFL
jgi:Lrp/AsnC family transcriptional regulator for asnA, asnC and gidA